MPQAPCTQTLQRELADSIVRMATLDDIRILLACGAKANEPVTQGLRPLHYAVYRQYVEAVQLLMVRGCDVNARDDVGYSAIHLCAERGYTDLIRLLLEHDAKVDFSARDSDEPFPRTTVAEEPLRLAIKNGHFETAKLLLENGANPNARYFLGSEINLINPLDLRFLELLLTFGANANSRDRSGLTPLMKACRHPNGLEAALLLIDHGADINATAGERHDNRSVLHYAVLSANSQIVEMLLKQGANVVFPPEYKKPTPLDFAILRGNPSLMRTLIKAGADVNAWSPIIGSPLHLACADNIQNRLEILKLLLENGADPNLTTQTDVGPELKTPLGEYIAANPEPEPEVIHLLLRYGAAVVVKSQYSDPRGILKSFPRLSPESQHIFTTLLATAQAFNMGAIQRSSSLSSARKDALMKQARTPLPLKHQMRLFLRRLLNPKGILPTLVAELPLPPLLKSYILFDII